jgi:hypothetical protein
MFWDAGLGARVIDAHTFEVRLGDRAVTATELAAINSGSGVRWMVQVQSGVAYEHQIALSNATQSDLWLCIPASATMDYIRSLAELVHAQLDPGLRVYLEWSNETWNAFFYSYYMQRAVAVERATSDQSAYAYMAGRVFDIFSEVFGNEARTRLVRLVAGQQVNPWVMEQILASIGDNVDAVSSSAYFNEGPTPTASLNLDQLMTNIIGNPNFMYRISNHAELARARGLRYIAYEAGQHLRADGAPWQSVFIAAQTDPRMAIAYRNMLNRFREVGGDLLVAFQNVGQSGPWGSWGHLEYQDSPVTQPKYRALREFMDSVQ